MPKVGDKPQVVPPPREATEMPGSNNSSAESNPPRSQDGSPTDGAAKQGSGSGRSALISDLVAQLKQGDITKAELFSRLQRLQGSGAAPDTEAGHSPADSGTKVATTADSVTPTGASPNIHDPHRPDPSPPEHSAAEAHASPGESAVVAESAGFFSAYDRQVSLQRGGGCCPRGRGVVPVVAAVTAVSELWVGPCVSRVKRSFRLPMLGLIIYVKSCSQDLECPVILSVSVW